MSLKGDKYETKEEVQFRLEHSVVLYEGRPVYITRVGFPADEDDDPDDAERVVGKREIARVYFQELPLGNRKEVRKYLSSRNFDLTPFKMGYLNFNKNAIFVSRAPVRQNKQGLSAGVTVYYNVRGMRMDGVINFNHMIRHQGFVDMVKGKYPSFKEAVEALDDSDVESVACSRSFAICIDHDLDSLILVHKGIRCGIAMKGDKAFKIPAKFRFLKEEMEDHRIPVMM